MKVWSPQQEAIFDRFATPTPRNFAARARAGTGKTTVIIEGVKRAPDKSIQLCAFNKSIEKELSLRIVGFSHVKAKTLHGTGCGIVMRNWSGIQIESDNRRGTRAKDITEAVTGGRVPDAAKALITKLHGKSREIFPHADSAGDLINLMYDFDILPDEYLEDMGYTPEVIEDFALKAMEFAASKKPVEMDFSDMIFLPCRNRWIRPGPNLVVVDEAQDMSPAQLEIAMGLARDRIVVVGDDRQAIYGFRGIDSNTFNKLIKTIDADVLPLTITYRCPQSVVRLAQLLVPDYEACETNPEGIVRNLHKEKLVEEAQENDFILSRLNAPLVSVAISLLKSGKRARVAGRDIGAGLKALIRKFKAKSIPDFLSKLSTWEERQMKRMQKAGREDKIGEIVDKADMLRTLFEEAPNMQFVDDRIDALFSDQEGRGVIMCSSVHKAKGLETQRVFTLDETFKSKFGATIEEDNIRYVAITRAQAELIRVVETKEWQ